MSFSGRVAVAAMSCLVAVGASTSVAVAADPPVPAKDHWHSAFGVWACDKWLPNPISEDDPTGIHTHGDGLIHIHPFDSRAAGKNAILKRFFEATNVKVSGTDVVVEGGPTLKAGDLCKGKKAEVFALVWQSIKDKTPRTFSGHIESLPLHDQQSIVIVYGPKGTNPGLPPSIANLIEPEDLPLPELPKAELAKLPALPPLPAFDLAGNIPTTLTTTDVTVGTGDTLVNGKRAYMRLVGYIVRSREEVVREWSASKQPYALARFGKKRNLAGFDKGMIGMKVGGVRRIVVPPSDGFGAAGSGPILGSDTVVFYVQLVAIKN